MTIRISPSIARIAGVLLCALAAGAGPADRDYEFRHDNVLGTSYDAYLKELLPYVRPGGLILAHNMRRPAPNPRYVEAITTSPDRDTSFVLMDGAGIGITLKKR